MRRARPAVALLVLAAPLVSAGADPRPLRYDLRADGAVTAAASAAWISTELAKGRLAPSLCRFCAPNALDAGTRERLLWTDVSSARRASDVLAFAIVPAGVIGHQLLAARASGDTGAGLVDVLLVAEAAALAVDLNQVVKLAVGRERPFVRYRNFGDRDRTPDPDDNLSFYSGHTTLAFSLASAAGTISTLRGYRSGPWVWAIGMTLATGVGYLRIAGDMHYLTDVLAGAAIGGAIGFAVPWFFHGREKGPGATSSTATATVTGIPLGFCVVF